MANTVVIPPTLPNPNAFLPGLVVKGSQVEQILETLNHVSAEGRCEFFIDQSFEDGIARHYGAAPEEPLLRWRIPLLSDAHQVVTVWARIEWQGDADPSTITVASVNNGLGNAISAAVGAAPAADDWLEVGDLEIASDEGPWDEIQVWIESFGDTDTDFVDLKQIAIEYKALPDPLPNTYGLATTTAAGWVPVGGNDGTPIFLTGSAYPFGLGTTVDQDRPLPAVRGHKIIDTLDHLLARPRVFMAWSGLHGDYTGVEDRHLTMPDHGIQLWALPYGYGVTDVGYPFTQWIWAAGDPDVSKYVRVVSSGELTSIVTESSRFIEDEALNWDGRFAQPLFLDSPNPWQVVYDRILPLSPGADIVQSMTLWGV